MNSLLNDCKHIQVSTLEKPEIVILKKNQNILSKRNRANNYNSNKLSKKKYISINIQDKKGKKEKYKGERVRERQLFKKKKRAYNSLKKKKRNLIRSKKISFNMTDNKVKEYVCCGLGEFQKTTSFSDGYETDNEGEYSNKFEIREMPEINLDELFN
jgi:hypothetical protein